MNVWYSFQSNWLCDGLINFPTLLLPLREGLLSSEIPSLILLWDQFLLCPRTDPDWSGDQVVRDGVSSLTLSLFTLSARCYNLLLTLREGLLSRKLPSPILHWHQLFGSLCHNTPDEVCSEQSSWSSCLLRGEEVCLPLPVSPDFRDKCVTLIPL